MTRLSPIRTTESMVISVPHSGTRTLKDLLCYPHDKKHWHFNSIYAEDIRAFAGHAHIPIRNPIDVAISWDTRYVNEYGGTIADMLKAFDEMLEFIDRYHRHTLYRMEEFKTRLGEGPSGPVRNTRESPRIDALRQWMTGDKMRFYESWYELEWSNG